MTRINDRWGQVYEISRDEWVSEVTECSKTCCVMVHLYSDSVPQCLLVEDSFLTLAAKFRHVKFMKIRSTQAVENWPDRNLPTIFVYIDGELKHQVLTLKSIGGNSCRADSLEWWLAEKNIVNSDLDECPYSSGNANHKDRISRLGGRFGHEDYDEEEED
jgi:hypothetical protein